MAQVDERRAPRASSRRRGRSAASGSTPSQRTGRRPRISSSATARWQPVSWDEAARRRRRARERPARRGRRARATRSRSSGRRRSSGRCSTSRSRSSARSALPIYANSSAKDAQFVVVALRGRRACSARTRSSARRSSRSGSRTSWTFAELDELRERGRAHAREHPDALREAAAKVDEDDLFTYIYTSGTTGPPKALHDPPPQLLRDGRRRRPARGLHDAPTTCCCSTCRSRTTSGG